MMVMRRRGGGEGGETLDSASTDDDGSDDGSGEGSGAHAGARWLELIDQDVARAYAVPFGFAGIMSRGATHRVIGGAARRSVLASLLSSPSHQQPHHHHELVASEALRDAAFERGRRSGGGGGGGKFLSSKNKNNTLIRRRSASSPASIPKVRPSLRRGGTSNITREDLASFLAKGVGISPQERQRQRHQLLLHSQSRSLPLLPLPTLPSPPLAPPPPRGLRRSSVFADLGIIPIIDSNDKEENEMNSVAAADDEEFIAKSKMSCTALRAVLLAIAVSEPTVRYTQGMHAVARMIFEVARVGCSTVFEEGGGEGGGEGTSTWPTLSGLSTSPVVLSATLCAANLGRAMMAIDDTNSLHLRALYAPDMRDLRLRLYQLDRLLLRRAPALHASLSAAGVRTSSYAAPWLLTLHSSFTALDYQGLVRIWDAVFAGGGWAPIFSASLSILFSLSPLLDGAPLEDALPILSAPRLYYTAAAEAAESSAVVVAVPGTLSSSSVMPMSSRSTTREASVEITRIVDAALMGEAARVTHEELIELEENHKSYGTYATHDL